MLAALLISQVGLPRRHIAFMYAAFALGAVDLAIYALTSAPWQAMVVAFIASCGWTAGTVTWNTLVQRAVPAEILGRVRSVDWLAATALVPLSFVIVGPLADWAGVRPVMIGCGVARVGLHRRRLPAPGHARHRKSALAQGELTFV